MLLPKDDATLARSFDPPKDRRPKFRFRIDCEESLIVSPQYVWAADEDAALDAFTEQMGPVPFTVRELRSVSTRPASLGAS